MGSSAAMYILVRVAEPPHRTRSKFHSDCYWKMAVATNVVMLFCSQLPAVFMHGFQAALLLVCFETDSTRRTPYIAYLNLSYGLGMVLGGFTGALVSTVVGPRGTLLVSGGIQICGCFATFALGE